MSLLGRIIIAIGVVLVVMGVVFTLGYLPGEWPLKGVTFRVIRLRSRIGCFGGVGKEGASVDSAGEWKDSTGVSPWRLHFLPATSLLISTL